MTIPILILQSHLTTEALLYTFIMFAVKPWLKPVWDDDDLNVI